MSWPRGLIARVELAQHLAHLDADGRRLAEAAGRAGWDARVPGLDWNVRDLVAHTGGIHRWAADAVANARQSLFDTEASRAVGSAPPVDALLDWFAEGHAALLATLRAAPDDLDCATFLPAPTPRAFWARRQAHETAIHRADAEAAAGDRTGFDADFAQDGIDELVRGFAGRRRSPLERKATIALRCTDGPSWLVRVGGERVEAEDGVDDPAGDLAVTGASSDVYLWLWNRPSGARAEGDESVAQVWSNGVRVRWSG
jgi:uncharacterized protein (TIGR03083 family)